MFYTWVPTGYDQEVQDFVRSYRDHDAGVDHDLVVLVKSDEPATKWMRDQLPEAEFKSVGPGGYDIGPFVAEAEDRQRADRLVLLGLYCRILDHDWLRKLAEAGPLASCTGSREIGPATGEFSAHLRTAGISIRPDLLRNWPVVQSKAECWRFEHGPESIYRVARQRGIDGVVVGRDGIAYPEDQWQASRTYRWGGQANLLIADHVTDGYAAASSSKKRDLERAAWPTVGGRVIVGSTGTSAITVITATIPGREKELARCMASVYGQTRSVGRHLIHAHADDGRPGMVQYSAAKNELLRAVETEWVAVLNDDDFWLANHIAEVELFLEGADVVYTWDAGRTRPRVDVSGWSHLRLARQIIEGNVIDGNALYRTSTLKAVGGFPTDWVGGGPRDGGHFKSGAVWEDQETWLRLIDHGAVFRCVPVETWSYSVDTPKRIGGTT